MPRRPAHGSTPAPGRRALALHLRPGMSTPGRAQSTSIRSPPPDGATMSKPTHHLNEFDPPARRRLAPAILIGLGVLVAAALIAGVVVRSGRALVPSGEE